MATTAREVTIHLRARTSQRDLIDRAAQIQGKTCTEFMLEAARENAEEVLLDKTFSALDERGFRHFAEVLDAPLAHQDLLVKLLAKRAPWDR